MGFTVAYIVNQKQKTTKISQNIVDFSALCCLDWQVVIIYNYYVIEITFITDGFVGETTGE